MRSLVVFTAVLALAGALSGCKDASSPRDRIPPAAPRGFYSVTGDGKVYLHWLPNTESDVAGYRIYISTCTSGPGCPFDRVASVAGTDYTVRDLANGQTRYFAVSAVDEAGNESDLSYDNVFDTPRPEGFDQALTDTTTNFGTSGWDFSTYTVRSAYDPLVDVFYVRSGGADRMVAPFVDTDIQDAGYASTLDAVDFAPTAGWSPTGIVELIAGHCYIVETGDVHYAKFRITSIGSGHLVMDWAYQTDPGNRELKARPVKGARVRRSFPIASR